MTLILKKPDEAPAIPAAFLSVIGTDAPEILRYFDDSVYDKEKGYNTYKLTSPKGAFVLKKYAYPEDLEDELKQYSRLLGMPAPKLLGASEGMILMEHVPGDDLKLPTDDGIRAFAKSLTMIMNAYPMGRGYAGERYARYMKRLEKRAGCLENEPKLKAGFALFCERQKDIPLSLSNADLLPINVLYDGEKATVIDWEFGGFLPYALDIARFIAHSRENGEVTGFRMTEAQKRLFVDLVYGGLENKPSREAYDRDIRLALLNEYVEILEYYLGDPTAERGAVYNDYYPRANRLAESLIAEG